MQCGLLQFLLENRRTDVKFLDSLDFYIRIRISVFRTALVNVYCTVIKDLRFADDVDLLAEYGIVGFNVPIDTL